MSLLLRNPRRDKRVEQIRGRLDELLREGEEGRDTVRDRLTTLKEQLTETDEIKEDP